MTKQRPAVKVSEAINALQVAKQLLMSQHNGRDAFSEHVAEVGELMRQLRDLRSELYQAEAE